MAGIGDKINSNMQLQEFTERVIGYVFDLIQYGDMAGDDICEDMGISEDEMYWLFEQLGYERDTELADDPLDEEDIEDWLDEELEED